MHVCNARLKMVQKSSKANTVLPVVAVCQEEMVLLESPRRSLFFRISERSLKC